MTPEQYCQNKAANSGSSFYYSFLFLPPEQRRAITAVYAFCREVDDVVDECRDAGMARIKLTWWREEIARVFAGEPQHPVGQALAPAVREFSLAQEYFQEIIDGMEMDLEPVRYASFKDLALYCYRVASVVGLLSAEIFGYQDRHTLKYAHDLGMAFQLTNILRDVGEDAQRGRVYLPEDEMAAHGVTAEDLHKGELTDALRALLALQARRARQYYEQAFAKLPERDRFAQRSGLIMAAVYMTLLDRIEGEGYPVLTRRVRLSPWRKLWIAWRTARREAVRHDRCV
ncbi:MAG: presqualene diphosphate synthase HpnD [Gammaproteobacteria bacterium]|nr:presqualene diphosphate synthase HpnD [Gammaproteobacteria bacterium]